MTPLTVSSIWRYARLGIIPAVKIGRRYMFDTEAVFSALEKNFSTVEVK
jgi:hypothetical protein